MYNPFNEIINEDETDNQLIIEVLKGSAGALEKIIYRHQAWVYNIALKMVFDPDDAEDITQEILLKIITHLSSYDPDKAAFRTWLYRIAANHILNMKKRKLENDVNLGYLNESFISSHDTIEDTRLSNRPDYTILQKEAKSMCLTGMLLCLERKQRLAFILGGLLGIPSSTGSEIMDISDVNFRALLSRGRKKLENFVNYKCGLLNPENPCRCSHHINKLISSGWIDPANPRLTKEVLQKISSIARNRARSVKSEISTALQVFADEPFFDGPGTVTVMKNLIGRDEFRDFFH